MQERGVWSEGNINEESLVKGCNNITFIDISQETVSLLEKTSKQNIQNVKAKGKTKQQQLSNKYSHRVFYLQATIIHNGNCHKIINNQARNMCA